MFNKTGTKAYVANYGSMDISIIDVTNFTLTGRIALAGKPFKVKRNGDHIWTICDTNDEVNIIDSTNDTLVKTTSIPGIAEVSNDIAFRPDGKLAVVTAADTGTITLIDSNISSTTFGEIFKTISTGGYLTALSFLPNSDYVYVINQTGGYVLACAISGGLDTLANAIAFVIDQIKMYLSSSNLSSSQKYLLREATNKLIGNNGGSAKNGALQKVNEGAIVAALVKIEQAIANLISAQNGLDTTELQKILTNGTMNDAKQAISNIEAKVGSSNPYIVLSWDLFQKGINYLNLGDYYNAVDYFKQAVAKAQDALK